MRHKFAGKGSLLPANTFPGSEEERAGRNMLEEPKLTHNPVWHPEATGIQCEIWPLMMMYNGGKCDGQVVKVEYESPKEQNEPLTGRKMAVEEQRRTL